MIFGFVKRQLAGAPVTGSGLPLKPMLKNRRSAFGEGCLKIVPKLLGFDRFAPAERRSWK